MKKTWKTPWAYLTNTLLLAGLLLLGTALFTGGVFNRTTRTLILLCGVYSMLAVSLNVCTGYLGQLPLGHAGFMAVGAYTGALFWKATLAWPQPLAIAVGLLLAAAAPIRYIWLCFVIGQGLCLIITWFTVTGKIALKETQ